jgi:hypothetical protein
MTDLTTSRKTDPQVTNWDHLHEQAIRLFRTKYKDSDLLAKELYLILQGLESVGTGPLAVDLGGISADPISIPPLGDLGFPALDYEFPEQLPREYQSPQVSNNETDPDKPTGKTVTELKLIRSMVPGVVTAHAGGEFYTMTLYPEGYSHFETPISGVPAGREITGVTVRQLQIASGAVIPTGTWAMVFRILFYGISRTTQLGQQQPASTTLDISAVYHEMQVPVWV